MFVFVFVRGGRSHAGRRSLNLLSALLLAGWAPARAADPVRVALVVSSRYGLSTEDPLRWADEDGDSVSEVLVAFGAVAPADLLRVTDADAAGLASAFTRAATRIEAHRANGAEVDFILYYVGHAGDGGLHLHGEAVALDVVKAGARRAGADRLLVAVDACQSGQLFRTQGAQRVPLPGLPVDFAPPAGEAWLTSSGAEQWSFEADHRRGALFTHFFVTALRGAADADGDGAVTVEEVAAFTRDQAATVAASFGQLQEPRVAGDLGAWVLATPGFAPSGLHVSGPVSAPVLVVSRDACNGPCQVVAEVPVGGGASIALAPGEWQLVSLDSQLGLRAVDLHLAAGEWRAVDPSAALIPTRGVRTMGGLVVVRPRSLSVAYTLASVPTLPLAQGLTLGLHQALGRGHSGGVVLAGGLAGFDNGVATGQATRVTGALDWRYDLLDARVRLSPGLRVGAGYLFERAARVPSETWGEWYGARDEAVTMRLPELHARAQVTLASGASRWGWQVSAGWGIEQVGALTASMAAIEVGGRRSFRGGVR